MKNQYFGDKRDFLKYQVIEGLATDLPHVQRLTCIWMLTPPTPNNDGNRKFVVHQRAERLGRFLIDCVSSGRRDVREIHRYYASAPFEFNSIGESSAAYFTSSSRSSYFDLIPDPALRQAVVFIDPDNGMEPRVATPAHLRYQELASVFARMASGSVAVVYQHLPRRTASEFWPEVGNRLADFLGAVVFFVAQGDVALYAIPKDRLDDRRVEGVLKSIAGGWPKPLLTGGPLIGRRL